MITLEVDKVKKATEPLQTGTPKEAIESLVRRRVESCSEFTGRVALCLYHPFVAACHQAYADHRPLVVSPDMFWLLVTQGLAKHINENAESMRHLFVQHEDKKLLEVRRDDFVKGAMENPWEEVFDEFSAQIKNHIGQENHANIVTTFSTTGKIEKAANEVVLMSAMQNYFEYKVRTMCGIPEITLEGEVQDWEMLRDRVSSLGEAYNLHWWTENLLPILDRISQCARGKDDRALWQNFYKRVGGSGGPYIQGWITQFFPYIEYGGEIEKNSLLGDDWVETRLFGGLTHDRLPSSLSLVPFKWDYLGQEYEMEFIAGFTSYSQDEETLAVRPKIGWAVRDKYAEIAGFDFKTFLGVHLSLAN